MASEFKLSYTGSEVNKKLGKIDGLVEAEERLTNEIAVERARINSFTALGEGSTTGDAELQDIRVDAIGVVYETAGAAVRALDSTLLQKTNPCVIDMNTEFAQGYPDISTGDFIANSKQRTSDFIELEEGVVYQCDIEFVNNQGNVQTYASVAYYNQDKSFSRWASMPVDITNIALKNNEKYIRMWISGQQINLLRMYPKDVGYAPIVTLNPELEIPQVGQITEEIEKIKGNGHLSDLIQEENPCVLTKDSTFYIGRLDGSTGELIEVPATSPRRTSDFVELEKHIVYQCDYEGIYDGKVHTSLDWILFYNSDKSFSRAGSMPATMSNIVLQNDEKYIRLQYAAQQLNTLRVYPKHIGYESETFLNPELKVPQIEKVKASGVGYIHARRPIIAFIFDGDYDRNATMEAIFSRHNMCIGFAPQYTTSFTNNSAETYLAWQKKGHEILAHGTYILSGDRYTDEQAKEYIKASYERMKAYGFDIHGFIGSHGKVDEKYLPTIKRYYDYASTENNHQYNGTIKESCLFFSTDSPYNLWRYSVQRTPLEQCKAAVDRVLETSGLLLLMGHADSRDIDQLTDENVEALLTYIEQVGATVKTPYEAIKDYYSIRYEDIVNSI